ncbi:MAG: membrane dipeptidase, partial [Clostridia bacterium]|nr:membrane dipeptidase [Clostridia bacterium]
DLDELINLLPFSTTLTWNDANKFAVGANTDLGLTDFGRHTICRLEENNILVDTAHMSRKSFYEFSKISILPIYNSHSNIDTLHSHNRNLTDDQIYTIVNSNGYMGLTIYEKFISNDKINSLDIAHQFDYLIRTFSSYHFGFGTDFYGIDTEYLPTDISSYEDLNTVANTLLDLHHSHDVVERIMYKNFLDFYYSTNRK